MTLYIALFLAGTVTIFLPCILPLIPVVLGVSVAGKSRLRPLATILGMVASFALFTFLLQVVLSRFVAVADIIQISTYYVLLLFGICFLTSNKPVQLLVAALGGFFYWKYGWVVMTVAEVAGWLAIEAGARIAARIQQLGSDVQTAARSGLGSDSILTAFIVGFTLGLVWVPCAGPALGFALALVRDEPGLTAFLALLSYALGTAVPLLIVGYGGQFAVASVRSLNKYTGRIKQFAGAVLILTSVGLQYGYLMEAQIWLAEHVPFGDFGTRIENALFAPARELSSISSTAPAEGRANSSASSGKQISSVTSVPSASSVSSSMNLPKLPKIVRAPEFSGLGPWHNSQPFTLASLKGKVVLVDFWTYSCINCIRTLPYIQGYWDKFKDMPFVLIGVHSPEFVFEKDEGNVKAAIKKRGLTYPVAQDNDFKTWSAFANRYWPAKYLIDAEGYIRYTHFGEGDYDETDLAIQSLLAEIGKTSSGPVIGTDASEGSRRPRSPEVYLGSRSWPAFANASGEPDDVVHSYVMPSAVPLHQYALAGQWRLADEERQVLESIEGEIRFHALGSEVNLVLGLEKGASPATADVYVDGKKTSTITISENDLFTLFTGEYGEHDVLLKIHGKGVAGYAYTFGA